MADHDPTTVDLIERVLNEHLWTRPTVMVAACTCDQWQRPHEDDDARWLWEAHRAKTVAATLRDAGRLLPEGGQTREEWGYRGGHHRRVITTWPDGSILTGPWEPVPDTKDGSDD